MNKDAILQAILGALQEEFDNFRIASKRTRETGNDSQSKSEGKYDTRSIEENYLADGLARQAVLTAEAATAFQKLEPRVFTRGEGIDIGALVELRFTGEDTPEWFFLGPAAGGLEVRVEEVAVTVLTPESPLGGRLMGAEAGQRLENPGAEIINVL